MGLQCSSSASLVALDLPWAPHWEFVIEMADGGKCVRTINLVFCKSLGSLKILSCASKMWRGEGEVSLQEEGKGEKKEPSVSPGWKENGAQ